MSPERHPHASAINLQTGARIALFGLAINVVLASVKIVAGFFGNAYVLIADGIESAMDVGGSIIIWGGLKVAARPPDPTHPYGHGKAEPIAAVIVAIGVLAAALGLAIQSVREIFLPHHGPAPYTLVVLIVPGVIEVEKCRVRKMGLDFYVDLHVGVKDSISVREGHEIAHQVKAAIQQNDSRVADVLVHIEPAQNL